MLENLSKTIETITKIAVSEERKEVLQPQGPHHGAMGLAGQPAAADHGKRITHAVRRPHPDDGGGRCPRHPYRTAHPGRADAAAQTRHLSPHLQPGAAYLSIISLRLNRQLPI